MFRRVVVAMALALSLNFLTNAHSDEKKCTQEEAIQAETEASKLNDWSSIYRSFTRFQQCDDGAISEGYSDSIGRLLAYHWNMLHKLNELTVADMEFRSFVIKHIDETIPNYQIKMIIMNARTTCPEECKHLCELINRAASAPPNE